MKVFFSTMVFLCVLATSALAQERHWYTSFKGGINHQTGAEASGYGLTATLNTETGAALAWSVGYAFKDWRVESELSWRRNDLDSVTLSGARFTSTGTNRASANGSVKNFAWMANGVYVLPLTDRFTALLLGGVGVARVTGELSRIGSADFAFDDEKTTFAYQVGVGAEYPLSQDFAFEVSYRFFGTPTVTFDDVDVDNTHHTGLFGLTMKF